jgi:transcriptional regulator with XRE-family HTH domain
MEIPDLRRRLRAAARTQAELAAFLGVSEGHVSYLLRSKKRMPLDTFRKIEAFLADAERKGGRQRGVAETITPFDHARMRFVTLEEARKPSGRPRMSDEERERWLRELRELGDAGRRLPRITDMTDDEILGYE